MDECYNSLREKDYEIRGEQVFQEEIRLTPYYYFRKYKSSLLVNSVSQDTEINEEPKKSRKKSNYQHCVVNYLGGLNCW